MNVGSSTSGEKHQAYLDALKLGPGDMVLMAQYVRGVRRLNEEISLLERMISRAAYQNEYARTIMSLPGFDAFSALLVTASIDHIERFEKATSLVSFMGLCPRVYQSGDSVRYGHMKKNADRTLTWVMMNAALVAKQHDPYLGAIPREPRQAPTRHDSPQPPGQQDGQVHLAYAEQEHTVPPRQNQILRSKAGAAEGVPLAICLAPTTPCNLWGRLQRLGDPDARHTTGARRPPHGRVFPPAAHETAGPCRTA